MTAPDWIDTLVDIAAGVPVIGRPEPTLTTPRGVDSMRRSPRGQIRTRGRWIGYVGGVSSLAVLRHARHDISRTVTVFGVRRGGTTWLQEVLSSGPGTCPIFEPTLYQFDIRNRGGSFEPVIPKGASAVDFESRMRKVMRGQRVTPWSLQLASIPCFLRADHLVVKHVNLSLTAAWLCEAFPDSPVIVAVRHPCAVVESLLNIWWGKTILAECSPELARRILELLDGRTSLAAAFAAMWAVEVSTLLHDAAPERAHLVAYEAAVADPAGVLGPLMESVGLPRPADLLVRVSRPSQTASAESATRQAGDPVTAWTDRLGADDRAQVLDIVRQSGLVGYGVDPYPDLDALAAAHRPTP
jgi:Sulfotransferase family